MGNITSYDAKDVVITVGGVYITGLGEDMVTGEKDEDSVSAQVGAQGDTVVNEVNNDLGTVTITVQGTSPQMPYLKKLAKSKTMTDIWVNNKKLNEKFGGSKAMIKKMPDLSYGSELEDREIEFQVFDYTAE